MEIAQTSPKIAVKSTSKVAMTPRHSLPVSFISHDAASERSPTIHLSVFDNELMHDVEQRHAVPINSLRIGEGRMPQTGCILCRAGLGVGVEVAVLGVKAGCSRRPNHVDRDLFTAPESHAKRKGIEDILRQTTPSRLRDEK